ncbi:CBS domain protein [Roseivirga ehrenbergii]|uniref:Nucleotidyltransferase n=1 Tax=Roseivirga ehrenbergii (strain DSM 102268 / JCM 13514 / KCTC 12282 / NCIMB 14502 / KMM 6017) TaxID=279360 RepID=A0A150XC39_ROSEK|nr:nucleotidyltransferase family protein [Roseivirga ehrenbergii]KYG76256.1 nucleotidyltransferase [Roseivirga ehrenbergii]TCL00216.1 CBS domain protein [Roseivirga ehrenbergii]
MIKVEDHIIIQGTKIKEALAKLNKLMQDAILFVVDEQGKLKGSLTDGDVRRGLLNDLGVDNTVDAFIQPSPKFIQKGNYDIQQVIDYRENDFRIIPVIDENNVIVNIINFRFQKSYLPLDAVVMAGGRGSRLQPMTDTVPKPLLKVGEKPIIDHNVDRLIKYGIDDFWISVRYLGEQLEEHYGDGSGKGVSIKYVWEDEPLGTIGAVSKISDFNHDYVLVTNSDLLTTLDYEDFFLDFLEKDADMSVVTIPYEHNVPYAVMETTDGLVSSFKEKPTYTYYSNGGIYLIKREILERIPKSGFYNSTDLMQALIESGKRLVAYSNRHYWLDIGKPDDYEKALKDIIHLNL